MVRHELVREWAIRRMTGTSGRQRFQADGFENYRVDAPEEVLLREFNAFATPLFERVAQLRDETMRLSDLRDSLLPELLSERIRVAVPEAAS